MLLTAEQHAKAMVPHVNTLSKSCHCATQTQLRRAVLERVHTELLTSMRARVCLHHLVSTFRVADAVRYR